MNHPYDISLAIESHDGSKLFSQKPDELRESSSTIKVPIVLLTARKMVEHKNKLSEFLERRPDHNTKGSGILNWTSAEFFSFSDLISTAMIYSDCLATNILIDYVGGRSKINKWLQDQGYRTKMASDYLLFDGSDAQMPEVGSTSAEEMLDIYRKLDNEPLPKDVRDIINWSSENVNESWLQTSLGFKLDNFRHKTGSMINCGPEGQTVYNAAGTLHRNGIKYYFCILSSGRIKKNSSPEATDPMRQHVAKYFTDAIKNL